MSHLTRYKRRCVSSWLDSLISSDQLEWPVHEVELGELYQHFIQSKEGYEKLFSKRRYFSYQLNLIIQEGNMENIVRRETHYPSYKVTYEFIHPSINESTEAEGKCIYIEIHNRFTANESSHMIDFLIYLKRRFKTLPHLNTLPFSKMSRSPKHVMTPFKHIPRLWGHLKISQVSHPDARKPVQSKSVLRSLSNIPNSWILQSIQDQI